MTVPPDETPLVVIGDVVCTQYAVHTPRGTIALSDARVDIADLTRTSRDIAQWAVIAAILGFFVVCIFSLLFLLIQEERTTGYIQVTVRGPGLFHTTQIAVHSAHDAMDLHARVRYAQSLTATPGSW